MDLSEIKKWNRQEYERLCQKLAGRKKEVVEGDTIKERGQAYRVSKNDARHIRRLKHAKAMGAQSNRSQKTVWKRRLWGGVNFALFMAVFISPLFWLGPLTNLDRDLSRALGGSLLLGAALSFWLQPVMEQAVQHGGVWRSLGADLWRNPLKNPGMLASLGAAIMYVIDWWPPFGSNIVPTMVDLVKSIIDIVKSLVG